MSDKDQANPFNSPVNSPASNNAGEAIKSLSFSGVKKSLAKQLFGKKHPWAEVVHLLIAVTLESKEQAEPLAHPLSAEKSQALLKGLRQDLKSSLRLPDFIKLYTPALPYPLDVLIKTRIEVDLWTAALVSQLHPERLKDFDFTPMDTAQGAQQSPSDSQQVKVGSPVLLNQFPSVGLLALPLYLIGPTEQAKKWAKQITKARDLDISTETLTVLNQGFGFEQTLFSCGFIAHHNLHQTVSDLFAKLPILMADSHLRHDVEDVLFITNHVFVFLCDKEIFLPVIEETHWAQFQGAISYGEYLQEVEYTQQLFAQSQFKLRQMKATPDMFGDDEARQREALRQASKNPMGLILPD